MGSSPIKFWHCSLSKTTRKINIYEPFSKRQQQLFSSEELFINMHFRVGTRNQPKNFWLRQEYQGFSSSTLPCKIIKNEDIVQLASNPFLNGTSKTRNLGFGYIHHTQSFIYSQTLSRHCSLLEKASLQQLCDFFT